MKKIAYLILAHDDDENLNRLINSLNYNSDFYIHIDKKADENKFKKYFTDFNNVFFVDDRYKVSWAGFNMIKATLELLEMCIKSKNEYMRIVLLSGADYPIKSNEYIHEFFKNNIDKEYIKAFNVTESKNKHYINQIKHYYFYDIDIDSIYCKKIMYKLLYIINLLRKKKTYINYETKKYDVYFGSQWWAITPKCAEYILSDKNKLERFNEYFKNSFAPDEKYFHTIIHNSNFKGNLAEKECICKDTTSSYGNVHIIHPSLSKTYTEKDINDVLKEDKLFVRKVNTNDSKQLLDILDIHRNSNDN